AESRMVDDHHAAVLVVIALALENEIEEVVGHAESPERSDQSAVLVRPDVVAIEHFLGPAAGEVEGLLAQLVAMTVIHQDEALSQLGDIGTCGIECLIAAEGGGSVGGETVRKQRDFLDDRAGGSVDVEASRA